MAYPLQVIAEKIKGKIIGGGRTIIAGVSSFERPKTGTITFIEKEKDLAALEMSEIAAILVPKTIQVSKKPLIQTDNPKLAFAHTLQLFFPARAFPGSVSPAAHIAKSAVLGKNVTVEPFAFIGERVRIGDDSVIRGFSHLDDDILIGNHTIIHSHVSIYAKTAIGSNVILHAGVIIGADGFGYVFDGREQVKVPQIGSVIIENDVEIGAGTTIDRGAIGVTLIGEGTKIDNLVQIAHNVQIGKHCAISAQTGISGSCKIGNGVIFGGGVGVADHVEIGEGAMLGSHAGVPQGKKIPPKQIWFGAPARPYHEMRRQVGAQLRAYENQTELRQLKKEIAGLLQELDALKASLKT